MKLTEKLNIDLDKKPIVTFASYIGTGKTTLLTILASEAYSDNKNILYVTETKALSVSRRFTKSVDTKKFDGHLTIVSIGLTETDLEPYFKKGYDLIIIDYPITNNEFSKLVGYSKENNVSVFISVQLNRYAPSEGVLETNKTALYSSDIFAIVSKKQKKDKTFLDKLMFWKKQSNVTVKLHKNRYGKQVSLDLKVDFENVKLK